MSKLRKIILVTLAIMMVCATNAQTISRRVTVFKDFEPVVVHLVNGKPLKVGAANIFLKNSRLLYKSGTKVLEAKMDNIQSVDFANKTYFRVDTVLAYRVDSVGQNGLYCATMIDMEAYALDMANKRTITNLEISSQVSMAALENNDKEDREYPLQNHYFIKFNGKFIKANELYVLKAVPKSKKKVFWETVRQVGFSWQHEDSLMELLRVISKD